MREPSANRVAAQSYIPPEPQHETLPGQILGSAVKQEDIKTENEKDERAKYLAILGERKKRKTTPSKEQTAAPKQPETPMYTHAHGHKCNRPDCNPIIVSKRGVIKPNRPSTGHSHISNIACQRMQQDRTAAAARLENADSQRTVKKTDLEQALKSMNKVTENTATVTEPKKGIDVAEGDLENAAKSVNKDTENTTLMTEPNNNTNTAERDAARGLLMLQQLAEMDLPDNTDDTPLVPLIPDLTTDSTADPQPGATHDDKSDDTMIYDPSDYRSTTNETTDTPEPPPPKGVLTIREVGIKNTPTGITDPVGRVTNEGKLRCDYCRRSFDTRTEKNLHIARRHADLAAVTTQKTANIDPNVDPKSTNKEIKPKNKSEGHAKNKNKNSKPTAAKSINKSDKTTSKECKKSDNTKSMNTSQKTTATRIRKYKCQICDRVFDQQSELNRHHKKRHPPV